ncbi:MAG: preprotein translocase subunit SecY [Firmicutes bacterium]|jgi:preprotein translocase subunit SecY|nr:preprotein translocase subunit SecY [Bacillota bacterium]
MFSTFVNAWKIKDQRTKILYTGLLIFLFRLGVHIPVPLIDPTAIRSIFSSSNFFGFLNVMSGGALKQMSFFALAVGPYITSSIVIQLLTVVIPSWEEMSKEGEEGRKKLQEYTRYITVALAMLQGYATVNYIGSQGGVQNPGFFSYFLISLTFTAGTMLLMWMSETIGEKGVGNGVSILIFSGIISQLPQAVVGMVRDVIAGEIPWWGVLILTIIALISVAGVVFITQGTRKIPVQYAKRVVGRKMYGGQNTHIPFKINQAGVLPVIFASSLLMFPETILQFINANWAQNLHRVMGIGTWLHTILYILLIFFFSFFYTMMQFNPIDTAKNMQKNGGFIPGIRPGRPTSDYISRVMTHLTVVGAAFLCILVLLPMFLSAVTSMETGFGGTTILIAISVALETIKSIEASVMQRHYKGFLD